MASGTKVRGAPARKVTKDQLDLAIAWLRGEVSYSAVKDVMKLTIGSNVYRFWATAVKEAYNRTASRPYDGPRF
jgi:hypothetical protein